MMTPDEMALRADLNKAAFKVGVAEHRWRLISIVWPIVLIGVVAGDGVEFTIRFDAMDYPEGVTGRLWSSGTNAPPAREQWPGTKGGRVGAVFRMDWKDGAALYLPCDRQSIVGHDIWCGQFPEQIWSRTKGITLYLELVHELLHCGDYVPGPRAAP